jgi:hypothetical protein
MLIAGLHNVSKFKAPGVILSKFDTESPQILGSISKNLVATANWRAICAPLGYKVQLVLIYAMLF